MNQLSLTPSEIIYIFESIKDENGIIDYDMFSKLLGVLEKVKKIIIFQIYIIKFKYLFFRIFLNMLLKEQNQQH